MSVGAGRIHHGGRFPLRVTQSRIARRLGLNVSTVNLILHRRQGLSFDPRTVEKVFRTATEMGYEIDTLPYRHHRRHPRRVVMAAVDVNVYRRDGTLHDRGSAVVKDLSLSGALLIAFTTPRRSIPLGPVTIGLQPLRGRADRPEVLGRLVRFCHAKDSLGFAIHFLDGQGSRARSFCDSLRPGR